MPDLDTDFRSWSRPFAFAHIGDLHLTAMNRDRSDVRWRRQRTLRSDLRRIFREVGAIQTGLLDFIYLPGDIADNGCADEYALLQDLAKKRKFSIRVIPGDHDRQLGTMTDFQAFRSKIETWYGIPQPVQNTLKRFAVGCPPKTYMTPADIDQFYYDEVHNGVHCIFLDVVSAGYGRKGFGLDFRLGEKQLSWLLETVAKAKHDDRPCVVFMHCYPNELKVDEEREALSGLFWNTGVRLVEMGHTHYNELAPDGRTLYATARSIGQNEDGPVGYAVGAIDRTPLNGIVTSWRFKQLQLGWPFVLITSPADRRLATAPLRQDSSGYITVRALAISDQNSDKVHCSCQVDGGLWLSMTPQATAGVFERAVAWPEGSRSLSVKIEDGRSQGHDFIDIDTIEPVSADYNQAFRPDGIGSNAQALGAWASKGLRGDQLGPNRGGHKW